MLFKDVDFKKITPLIPLIKRRVYRQNEYIYKEGDNAKKLYFVFNGQVEL